jgi:hypothetical protein
MSSKRNKNLQKFGRMNSLASPLKELLKYLKTPLEIFMNIKKILMVAPPKNRIHIMMFLFLLYQSHQWIYNMQQKEEVPK